MQQQIAACVIVSLASTAMAVPTILNPDLTGASIAGTAPPDWYNWQKTPDTANATGPFNNTPTPWTLSPNGGTFVRTGGTYDFAQSEAFAQTVTGFTPGATYSVEFFYTNLGFEHPTSGEWIGTDGYYDVLVDGTFAGATAALSKPATNLDAISWSPGAVTFVAPAASFDLIFAGRSADPSGLAAYMGIDGISVHEVPAPATGGVFLAMGLASTRRRRR